MVGGRCLFLGALFSCLACASVAQFSYLSDVYSPPQSDEYGQHRGIKTTTCKCGWTNKARGRIVGGTEAHVNEYPHMAALAKVFDDGIISVFCGSTIISQYHAVTAAHCTHLETGPLVIIIGEHDLTTADESEYTRQHEVTYLNHEGYDPATNKNDIALLISKFRIFYNDFVGPACLPNRPIDLEGQYVKVYGWGTLEFKGRSPSTLNKVSLKVVSLGECAAQYNKQGSTLISTVQPKQFCTFMPSKDSCQGDSGGPVTWLDPETNMYTLVGVVSYGKGCASGVPGVNTDVYSYLDWILENMKKSPKKSTACFKED